MTTPPRRSGLFDRSGTVRRPALRLLAGEAAAQLARYDKAGAARALAAAPAGDGHPVLVLPAFLKGDGSTRPLRQFLKRLGYASYGWDLGANIGPTDAVLTGSRERLEAIARRHGRRVSLIGHSLGGVIARELGKQAPGSVRRIITLCSPFRPPIASNVELLFRLLAPWHSADVPALWAGLEMPPPAPTTAVYTRTDGIVSWQSCLETPGLDRENVEVGGWHGTMARNSAAFAIIAERLARPEDITVAALQDADRADAPG